MKIPMSQENPIFFGTPKLFANDQQKYETARAENVYIFLERVGASRAPILFRRPTVV